MGNPFPVLGFDIGGTKVAVCLAASDGKILGSSRIDNYHRTPDEVLPAMVGAGRKLLADAGLKSSDLKAIGIDAPAPMDIPNGLIVNPPNNPGWFRVPVRDFIAGEFGVETFFENDANAGALAEWFFGAATGCDSIIYLTMSTGIGGGVIIDGRLLHGKGFHAGEIGHMVLDINGPKCNCGLKGCYEAFCGGRAVAQRMQKELAGQPDHPVIRLAGGDISRLEMKTLTEAVRENNDYALKLWDEICLRNAQAIGNILNALNPEKIVLGTLAWAVGDLLLDPIRKYLPRFCWGETREDCTITASALGREIGEYSGVSVALYGLYQRGEYQLSVKG